MSDTCGVINLPFQGAFLHVFYIGALPRIKIKSGFQPSFLKISSHWLAITSGFNSDFTGEWIISFDEGNSPIITGKEPKASPIPL